MAGDGVLICSIDNLPAQLPREATDYFGKLLLPWLPEMVIEQDTILIACMNCKLGHIHWSARPFTSFILLPQSA